MSEPAVQTIVVSPQDHSPTTEETRWAQVMALPCTVSIEIPMPGFTVLDLLKLHPRSIIGSQWPTTANLPLRVNGELIAWCEFEVLGNRIAVRLTEIA